jgi:glycosyltransferase involved in cell wall biosynthesis
MKICALIPAFNEWNRIGRVVSEVRPLLDRVIVVDDGSTDGTASAARDAGAIVLIHSKNRGKGTALMTGFRECLAQSFDAVITLDGDGQHSPAEVKRLIECMHTTKADVVIGSRMGDTSSMPGIRIFTNRMCSSLVSWLCGQRVNDTQSGFRLIRSAVLRDVRLSWAGYEMESEFLVEASRKRYRFAETPVSTIYGPGTSKMAPARETARFLGFVASRHAKWLMT